jgi:hypothetical protein
MAQVERIRCPLCGLFRNPKRLGITEEGFDPELLPQHDLTLIIDTIGGRGKLSCEHRPLPLATAQALRAALAEALARLDAELATVTSET